MKKASAKKYPKKSLKKEKSFLNAKNVQWFGIDIHHIALGVSFVGCLVALLLVQKKNLIQEQQAQVLSAQIGASIPNVSRDVPSCDNGNCSIISPVPQVTCIPRPPCLNAIPKCSIPEPVRGWCSTNSSLTPTVTASTGCFTHTICSIGSKVCPATSKDCQSGCHQITVCPSGIPHPSITGISLLKNPFPSCMPRPWCLDHSPRCMIAEPAKGWCPPTITSPQLTCVPFPTCSVGKRCSQLMKGCMPNITPPVKPSCGPVPTCDPRLGIACKIMPPCGQQEPKITAVITNIASSSGGNVTNSANPITNIWNTFLRGIFGIK